MKVIAQRKARSERAPFYRERCECMGVIDGGDGAAAGLKNMAEAQRAADHSDKDMSAVEGQPNCEQHLVESITAAW